MDSEFKIKNVKFRVEKLSALNGWHVLERCREAIATNRAPESDVLPGAAGVAVGFYKSLMGLPTDFVDWLRGKMFSCVSFQAVTPYGKPQPWMPLSGAEDMAFQDLGPHHVYEISMRAFVVNFTECWEDVASRFPAVAQMVGDRPKPKTSTPSSSDQSTQDSVDTETFTPYP